MENTLVCVTRQISCERLIETGAKRVAEHGGALSVVHVAAPGASFLGSPSEGEALEYLFSIAKRHGADMTVVRSADVVGALVRHARNKQAACIILGVTSAHIASGGNVEIELGRQLPQAHIIAVPA